MSLREKKSLFDRNQKGNLGNKVGQNPPNLGNFFTDAGASNSPFDSNDHMVDLLTKQVASPNSEQTYDPSPNQSDFQDLDGELGPQFQLGRAAASQKHIDSLTKQSTYTYGNSTEVVGPTPGGDSNSPFQDLDGRTGGNGFFHGIPSPGKLQGKQLGGVDLHEKLLTDSYTYGHAPGFFTTILGENEKGKKGGTFDLDGLRPGQNGFFHNIDSPQKLQGLNSTF